MLFKTDISSEADVKVYLTDVCFTANQWDADLVVFKTDVQSDAGWIKSDKARLL